MSGLLRRLFPLGKVARQAADLFSVLPRGPRGVCSCGCLICSPPEFDPRAVVLALVLILVLVLAPVLVVPFVWSCVYAAAAPAPDRVGETPDPSLYG